MTVNSNTVQTFAMVGIREELSDTISNIAPYETPFYSMTKKGKCTTRSPEWLEDTLAAANHDNKVVEGTADPANDTTAQPARKKNYVQLMDKIVEVSTTAQAVQTAGRDNDLKYQMAKKGKELKTDIEKRITGNYASVIGNASTAGETAGAEAFIATNGSRGASGVAHGYNSGTGIVDAAEDGTQRAFTETLLKDVVREVWTAGGEPSIVMVGPFNKQKASAFTGIATQYRENTGTRHAIILGAADVYVSDFGELRIVPSRISRDRTALVLDPKTWGVDFLQPMKQEPLAKTGHADRRMLSCELTLKCMNEKANSVVADLTTA